MAIFVSRDADPHEATMPAAPKVTLNVQYDQSRDGHIMYFEESACDSDFAHLRADDILPASKAPVGHLKEAPPVSAAVRLFVILLGRRPSADRRTQFTRLLFDGFPEILEHMKAIRDLPCPRHTPTRAIGVQARAIAPDDLRVGPHRSVELMIGTPDGFGKMDVRLNQPTIDLVFYWLRVLICTRPDEQERSVGQARSPAAR
jgi:hypothetical protein